MGRPRISNRLPRIFFVFCLAFISLALALIVFSAPRAHAAPRAVITVVNTNDGGAGSLRDAIVSANPLGGDAIDFTLSLPATITLSSQLLITKPLTISGPGAALLTINGNSTTRVISVTSGVIVDLSNVTISNGSAIGRGGGVYNDGTLNIHSTIFFNNMGSDGGAIFNGGTLVMTSDSVSTNHGSVGAGIYTSGTLTLLNSTISNNTNPGSAGGGVYQAGGSMTVTNSTFVGNGTGWGGGGIYVGAGTLTVINSTFYGNNATTGGAIYNFSSLMITNSTFAGNTGSFGSAIYGAATLRNSIIANNWCSGTMTSAGNNLDDGNTCSFNASGDMTNTNPLLSPLANNGGPVQTMALLPSSPAIDSANLAYCPSTDQRGFPRFGSCDIGAYELQPIGFSTKSVSPTTAVPGAALAFTITLNNPGLTDLANVTMTDTLPVTLTYVGNSLGASGGSFGQAGGVITWTGSLNSSTAVTLTFGATVQLNSLPGNIVNASVINNGGEVLTRTATITIVNAPGPRYVTSNGSDSNDCLSPAAPCATINGALVKVGPGETVFIATGVYTGTGGSAVVTLDKSASLSGGWNTSFTVQGGMSTIDGQNARGGVWANSLSYLTATLDSLIIQNGLANRGGGIFNGHGNLTLVHSSVISNSTNAGGGGGIFNDFYNTLTISNSTISHNATSDFGSNGPDGGGIYNGFGGIVAVNNSTISSNSAYLPRNAWGGGIYDYNSVAGTGVGSILLNNSTIANNSAYTGGGILASSSRLSMKNSIIAKNTASSGTGPDCYISISSLGYNLIENTSNCSFVLGPGDRTNISANLGPLQNNGGASETHALQFPSPAIDTGNPTGCTDNQGNPLNTDQRGLPRVRRCDMGAFEFQGTISQVFLPLIEKPDFGINGHVTYGGASASGIAVDLRFYNGSTWSTIASTTTNGAGDFKFLSAPSLGAGQKYYVRYSNSADETKLSFWGTRILTAFTGGTSVAIGNFDIANVALTSPAPGASVNLPQAFQWTRRNATPTDNYEFNLLDLSDHIPWWWTDPPLGYVNSFTLNSLPLGFVPGPYYWYLGVYSPDGGYGESYYAYLVNFSNSGLAPAPRAPIHSLPNRTDLPPPKPLRR